MIDDLDIEVHMILVYLRRNEAYQVSSVLSAKQNEEILQCVRAGQPFKV